MKILSPKKVNVLSDLVKFDIILNKMNMGAKYYVAIRPQTNEHHTVHSEGCPFLPEDEKRIYLGMFNSVQDAIREGRRHFARTICCLFCLKKHQPERKQPVFHEPEFVGNIPSYSQISLSLKDSLIYFLN